MGHEAARGQKFGVVWSRPGVWDAATPWRMHPEKGRINPYAPFACSFRESAESGHLQASFRLSLTSLVPASQSQPSTLPPELFAPL